MSLPPETLRALAVARKRPFKIFLGQLDKGLVEDLLEFYEVRKHENILTAALEDRAGRKLEVVDGAYLSERYCQIELQGLKPGGNAERREDFVIAKSPALMSQMETIVGPCYRSRISALQPGGSIPRHVDDPTQLRVISVLKGGHDFCLFNRAGRLEIPMKVGELWFVNTAWEHAVANSGTMDRVALLLNLFELPDSCDEVPCKNQGG